jgi:hypothetical protein
MRRVGSPLSAACSTRQSHIWAGLIAWSTTPDRRPDRSGRNQSRGDWDRCLAVDLTSHSIAPGSRSRIWRKSKNASIMNLSSQAGKHGFPLRLPVRRRQGV